MNHLPVIPILLPFVAAAALLLLPQRLHRQAAITAVLLGLAAATLLMRQANSGVIAVYSLGNWPAPFGISLVADRLAAMMVLLTYALALSALLAGTAIAGRAPHYHLLFQLLLAGLCGAFLTGDLFNLFVFFEILLLASYALLLHGGGNARSGIVYVVLNLLGSALFLIALGLLYGTMGTLNLADLGRLLGTVPAADAALVRTILVLLVAVFLLKAAIVPMAFWLPRSYASAAPSVGILFALLTKVGIVSLLRLVTAVFGTAPVASDLLLPWLPLLALLTMALATAGVFAANRLAMLTANLVLLSSGTLIFAVAFGDARATAALLFYLPHSTLVTAGLFLLGGLIAERRGTLGDMLTKGPCVGNRAVLATAFAILAVAVAGLPPLAGFLGKLMLMQTLPESWRLAWWLALLGSSFGVTLVLARTASTLFWQPLEPLPKVPITTGPALALILLAAASPLITLTAAPVAAWAEATAVQLHTPQLYEQAVLGSAQTPRESRP